ncbi:hypothetical protein [Thioclava sp. GXIMD4215]|uniref:hypothetical protein n=1 Tax=Thioclava sp. GXIMD4215 TaxID=3131928 RepID=UPI00324B71ED
MIDIADAALGGTGKSHGDLVGEISGFPFEVYVWPSYHTAGFELRLPDVRHFVRQADLRGFKVRNLRRAASGIDHSQHDTGRLGVQVIQRTGLEKHVPDPNRQDYFRRV